MTPSQASFRFPETFEHPVCARHGASCWANTGEQDESLPLGASLPCRWCAWHILGAPSLHGTSPSRSRRHSPVSRATEAAAGGEQTHYFHREGMLCKGALQEASWRHDQKPRGCWARRPRHPKGLCASLPKWAKGSRCRWELSALAAGASLDSSWGFPGEPKALSHY